MSEPTHWRGRTAGALLGILVGLGGCAATSQTAGGEVTAATARPGQLLRDCPECPEMVVVPPGTFIMGSTREEQDFSVGQGRGRKYTDRENPRHEVRIDQPFAVGRFEVTRDQFAAFVRATGHSVPPGCQTYEFAETTFKRTPRPDRSWQDPGYPQAGNHPVACLRWDDARAYADWLSRTTGESYRLLSEAEWEYVARAGTTTYRYWGDDKEDREACRYANVADQTRTPEGRVWQTDHVYSCTDGYWATSPAGAFKPNAFGVYDIIGNVWEWLEDCAHESYEGAPGDGRARTSSGDCARRPLRGGAFHENGAYTRIAMRGLNTRHSQYNTDGFRVARDLPAKR